MPRLLRRVESVVPRRSQVFGGKARNLAALARAGFPVPAAYAMSGDVAAEHLHALFGEDMVERVVLGSINLSEAELATTADRVRSSRLSHPLEAALREVFETLRREGATSVAVRSSASHEDDRRASAAGVHHTALHVADERALFAAVRECWASLLSKSAITYLRTQRLTSVPKMGVLVQAMVPADVSGVLFTMNPLTGDSSEMVVSAAYGLGSAVADGTVSPDTFRIDKATGQLRDHVVGEKEKRLELCPEGGVVEVDVPQELRERPCLDEGWVTELANLGRRIEDHFDDPRDVEWAISGGNLYVLQARPITAVPAHVERRRVRKKRADSIERARIVWSNVNVGEALPGVASPLTWSILSRFSELGFRRAFGALGCTVPKDAELVGNFRGRIYLNLSEFTAIASQVPGLRPSTLLALGGGAEAERLEADLQRRKATAFIARLPVTASRFVRENYRITKKVAEFDAASGEELRRLDRLDFRVLSPLSLDRTLYDVERLLDDAGAIMLTCYSNLLSSVILLRSVLSLVSGGRAAALERGLLSGLADVESAAPGLALFHIAEMARREPAVLAPLEGSDPGTLRLESLPDGPTRRALLNFLKAYGHRGVREAELSEPRWKEDPSLLFRSLALQLGSNANLPSPLEIERRQRRVREEAEAALDKLIPLPGRFAVRHLLSLVQRFTRLRERLRGEVTRVLGLFRRIALDSSERVARIDPTAGGDSTFFLTLDELHALLRGSLEDVSSLVRQRRRQYERDRALPDPPSTFIGYPPAAPIATSEGRELVGLGASSGRAEGVARVVFRPADAKDFAAGEVLVVPYADVGWSPLFVLSAAVVTDLGGPLSHAAVVLREYGIPAVVNVADGTRRIRSGDRIVVDGDRGLVTWVDPKREGTFAVHGSEVSAP